MKQQQQPTEPSANELRAMWGAGRRRWRVTTKTLCLPQNPTEVCLICIIGIMFIIGIVIVNDVLALCVARRGGIMV